MMVNYPTSLDTDGTLYDVTDHIDNVLAIHHNALKDAVIALETALGVTGTFNFTTDAEFTGHTGSANPHSGSASSSDLTTHAALTASHGVAQIANHAEIASQIATHTALGDAHHAESHAYDTHSGAVPLADLAAGSQGSIMIRGVADWEELVFGANDKVLQLVGGYPSWEDAPAGYTDTDTEAVITAELADGQSIDNAIDALIGTHNVADNHLNWKNSVGTIHTDNYIEGGAGTDTTAIHDNVANEITAITPKTTLAAADELLLEDSAAVFVKKAVTFANIEGSMSLANLGTRSHASLSDAPADAHHAKDHAATHQDGGADKIDVTDLSGLLADKQEPKLHAAAHEDGGLDLLELDKLSGLCKDAQTPLSHNNSAHSETYATTAQLHDEGHVLATTGPHTGTLPLADLAAGSQGSVIIRGAADWEELGYGADGHVLTAGGVGVSPVWEAPGSGADNLGNHTATEDLNMATWDIENMGTVYHDDDTHYLSRVTSDGTDGGTLHEIGVYWDTSTNYLHFRGYTQTRLDVQTTNVLAATSDTVTMPLGYHTYTSWGLTQTPSLVLGVNATHSGRLKLLGRTSGSYGNLMMTTNNFHIDAVDGGNLYLNWYDGDNVLIGSACKLNVNSIVAQTDPDHRILMYPAVDEIHIYPGSVSTDNPIKLNSTDNTSSNPKIYPPGDQYGYLGTAPYEWKYVYSQYVYRNGSALDEHDDLAIIDGIGIKRVKGKTIRNDQGNPLIDVTTLPDVMRGDKSDPNNNGGENKSHIELGAWTDLAVGGVKQLHRKHRDLEDQLLEMIEQLNKRIEELEKVN